MSRFLRDEYCTQCYGSYMDLVARAIYEDPVVIDYLLKCLSLEI